MAAEPIELRTITASDGGSIYSAWGRRPENFRRTTASVFRDVADANTFVAGLFSAPKNLAFHIVTSTGDVIGIVKASVVGHRAQVGYVIDQAHWGRGIATLAVQNIVAVLEENPLIERIWATCAIDNPGSVRVLEKCGFQREGVLRNWVIFPALGDRAVDNYSYVRIPGET